MVARDILVALCAIALYLLALVPSRAEPAINPDVTEDTMAATICVKGWTATVRPPYWTMQKVKGQMMREAGADYMHPEAYQLDHIVPLCLGGAPFDGSNLQLQPIEQAHRKDRVEAVACRCVCNGVVGLEEARADFKGDWQAAYHKYAKMSCGQRAIDARKAAAP